MNGKLHLRRRDVALTLALLMALGAGAWLVRNQTSGSQGRAAAPGGAGGVISVVDPRLYVAEPGGRPGAESDMLLNMDAYWQARITYPTGKFDRNWLAQAAV